MVRVPRPRRRLLLAALAVLAVLSAGASVAAWQLLGEEGDVLNEDVPFVDPAATTPAPAPRAGKPARSRRRIVEWPLYGFDKRHTRQYRERLPLRAPFRRVWRHRAPALLEFPPVIFRDAIYQLADNGVLYSLNKNTGRKRWRRKLGALSASSPAVGGASVYVTLLERRKGVRRGRVVALRQRGGRIRWSRDLPSRTESSPLLHRGRLYLGSEDGTVYALNAHNGRIVWRYRATGAVKGSLALAHGKLFFGDYGGTVHAIRLRTGRRVWSEPAARRALRGGRFYATAAVSFGRVYIGATDGRVYSLSTRDGRVAWARQTGGYVYSSAAVHDVDGLGPAVFVGSYDGTLYALSARTGRTLWRHASGGRISGSPTMIGDTVYFSSLGRSNTAGLRARDGRVVFRYRHGAFDPAVSDGRHLFLTGRSSLTAFVPRRGRLSERPPRASRERKAERPKGKPRKARKARKARKRRP
jgi:outer membrane protein assembly factor BamB